MTGTGDKVGEDQAVVFLSSLSVDQEGKNGPNASTPAFVNGYGTSVDGNRHLGKGAIIGSTFSARMRRHWKQR